MTEEAYIFNFFSTADLEIIIGSEVSGWNIGWKY